MTAEAGIAYEDGGVTGAGVIWLLLGGGGGGRMVTGGGGGRMVTGGATTVQLAAAVANPAGLVTSTVSACLPSARPLKATGLEHFAKAEPSRLQEVEAAFLDVNENLALVAVVEAAGELVN